MGLEAAGGDASWHLTSHGRHGMTNGIVDPEYVQGYVQRQIRRIYPLADYGNLSNVDNVSVGTPWWIQGGTGVLEF